MSQDRLRQVKNKINERTANGTNNPSQQKQTEQSPTPRAGARRTYQSRYGSEHTELVLDLPTSVDTAARTHPGFVRQSLVFHTQFGG